MDFTLNISSAALVAIAALGYLVAAVTPIAILLIARKSERERIAELTEVSESETEFVQNWKQL